MKLMPVRFLPVRFLPVRFLPVRSLFAACALLAAGCTDPEKDTYVEAPVENLYNEATDSMLNGSYDAASKKFDEVERQHPYSVWATKAQLMSAYALYQRNRYDESLVALDRFIQLHPGNRDAPYAYYLKALNYYEQIADVGRDQRLTDRALKALEEVVRRFPESVYARDARIKIDLTRDHLAGKEMEIGRFYERQGQQVAAINRFRMVIEKFQTTTHVPEALHRLTECYLAVGLREEAQTSAAVLGHNFPGSEWYQASYALLEGVNLQPAEDQGSWMSRALASINPF
jgi:outer membrane protein assembly factor BamD